MIQRRGSSVSRQIEVLWNLGTLSAMSDTQLMARFRDGGDPARESAFRELVHRHGPMVMGVCRQVLRHPHDVEDAFQSTFLLLVHKSRSITAPESLGPWLHSVAYRTAWRARNTVSRYRQAESTELEAVETRSTDADHLDLRPVLHEELGRLPDKYRAPIVLCHLEGKTHEEAARLLRWPVGTLSGRLSRGRQLLKSRLERRGLAVPSIILLCSWLDIPRAVPVSLVDLAVKVATSFTAGKSISVSVLSLTHGVLRTMLLKKFKTISLAVLLLGAVTGGVGVWAHRPAQAALRHNHVVAPTSDSIASVAAKPGADSTSHDAAQDSVAAPSSSCDDCPWDCPLANGELPAGCPLTMAANAVSRFISYLHDRP
jgi:RNA polymerase sigma factor (sigma-70 family)